MQLETRRDNNIHHEEAEPVALAGLGQMGRALAKQLLGKGYVITGIDPNEEAREHCNNMGLECHESVFCIERSVKSLLICVPTPQALLDVVEDFSLKTQQPDLKYIVNMSTVGPQTSMHVEGLLMETNPDVAYVEAPVSGGVLKTARGEASILCGCRDWSMAVPVARMLEQISSRVITFPNVYQASIAKLVNNIAIVNNALGTLEAISFGVQSGLTLEAIFETMENGTAASYALSSTLRRPLMTGDYRTGFALRLALKDMVIASKQGRELGQEMPYTQLSIEKLKAGERAGLGDLVFPSIATLQSVLEHSYETELEENGTE